MKKLLKPLDVFLLGLSGAVDLFNDLKDPFDLVRNGYENMYGWIPKRFRKTSYNQMVYHALRTGYIEKVTKNGEVYFRLTSIGRERNVRDFSITNLQNKRWDRKWRIVIFDIEEKERKNRDILRLKLKELGFGMIQESVWISPHDVAIDFQEFIKSVGLNKSVIVMEVNHLLVGDQKTLAEEIWKLDDLNLKYEELYYMLMKLHDRVKTPTAKEEKDKEKLEKEKREARMKYLEILKDDPCLPKELLPENWYGEKVKEYFRG